MRCLPTLRSYFQEFIRTICATNPSIACCLERVENNEILRYEKQTCNGTPNTLFDFSWSGRLELARVTHWGGMISTPDIVLQDTIKHALLESGCPLDVTNELMENAHERHWPEGLSTLGKSQSTNGGISNRICRF